MSFKLRSIILRVIPEQIKKKYRIIKTKRNYVGNNVYCHICGLYFKSFMPFGNPRRENAKCINCGSLERHRLLWIYLKEKTNVLNDRKIKLLHFAPEKPFYNLFSSSSNIDYYPCDIDPSKYNYENPSKINRVDITAIPFENDFFDVILCSHVLEHVNDDTQAMLELRRVLNKNGWGIFQVPIDVSLKETHEDFSINTPEAREKAFGQHDHVRIYGLDYKEKLINTGFNVTVDNFIRSFNEMDIHKYGFDSKELIYVCRV